MQASHRAAEKPARAGSHTPPPAVGHAPVTGGVALARPNTQSTWACSAATAAGLATARHAWTHVASVQRPTQAASTEHPMLASSTITSRGAVASVRSSAASAGGAAVPQPAVASAANKAKRLSFMGRTLVTRPARPPTVSAPSRGARALSRASGSGAVIDNRERPL